MDHITRRRLLALSAAVLASPLFAAAQQLTKVYRIGVLFSGSPESSLTQTMLDVLRQGLREHGYAEGRNIAFEPRYAKGKYELFPELAAELVGLKVDVIVAVPTPAALAARNATGTIPIVVVAGGDLVGTGLVSSLARPGRNITGHSILAPEIVGKQLELLRETVPGLSRVAVLRNPTQPPQAAMSREAEVAARVLGMQVQLLEAGGPDEFDSAFAAMTRERAGGLLVLADAIFIAGRPARGTTDQVRLDHQPQDRQGARPGDPAVAAAARGPGDRIGSPPDEPFVRERVSPAALEARPRDARE
ncbi:MAG: ABC transporter substrate-binding protein [Candidatus Rokubacteria bacterium]|nr:ABC transporter substrate-binding protein [Candidatus Rokubacteria bacterium]